MNLARLSPRERRAALGAYRLPASPRSPLSPPELDPKPSPNFDSGPDALAPADTRPPETPRDRGPSAPDSLPEPPPSPKRSRFMGVVRTVGWHLYYHAGPGILASVAYFDPGNWTVDIQAGANYGYGLLFVVFISGLTAVFLQVLASRMGVVTGRDLAQHTRLLLHPSPLTRRLLLYPLYFISECAILFTDLAELLGTAIALSLIFPSLPLYAGVLITSVDVMVVLLLWGGRGGRWFELGVVALCAGVLGAFVVLIVRVGPDWGEAFKGFIPNNQIFQPGALYISIGILGATVMPHALYLGSALATQTREPAPMPISLPLPCVSSPPPSPTKPAALLHSEKVPGPALGSRVKALLVYDPATQSITRQEENNALGWVRRHLWHAEVDVVGSLVGLALVINAAILILGATAFYYQTGGPTQDADIFSAHALLGSTLGAPAAFLFAFALLCSGQSASLTATMAGQIVSEGFLEWKMSPFLRRLVTRLLGLIPATIVAAAFGRAGLDTLLVASQVALSICLPGVIFPLLWITGGRRGRMVVRGDERERVPGGGEHQRAGPGGGEVRQVRVEQVEEARQHEEEEGETVDYRNAWYVTGVGWLLWLVIVVANVYAIVELGIGGTG